MHTYSAIYVHVIFATWERRPTLTGDLRTALHAYAGGIARNHGVSDVHVGGIEDHLHLFGRFSPSSPVSATIGELKKSSGDWIRERTPEFRWQRGFGAFSVSPGRIHVVQRYVREQERHHRKRNFRSELEELVRETGVSADDLGLL